MSNEIKCQYGQSVQWLGDDGGWNIGHIVQTEVEPVYVDDCRPDVLIQPYHGGPPIFVRDYQIRNQPHEEPTTWPAYSPAHSAEARTS